MKCAVCQTTHFFFLIDPEEEAFLKGALEVGKPGLKAPKAGVLRKSDFIQKSYTRFNTNSPINEKRWY